MTTADVSATRHQIRQATRRLGRDIRTGVATALASALQEQRLEGVEDEDKRKVLVGNRAYRRERGLRNSRIRKLLRRQKARA